MSDSDILVSLLSVGGFCVLRWWAVDLLDCEVRGTRLALLMISSFNFLRGDVWHGSGVVVCVASLRLGGNALTRYNVWRDGSV